MDAVIGVLLHVATLMFLLRSGPVAVVRPVRSLRQAPLPGAPGLILRRLRVYWFPCASELVVGEPARAVNSVLAIGGVGGLAVGLAGREILENLFTGLIILSSSPFEVGDEVLFTPPSGPVRRPASTVWLMRHPLQWLTRKTLRQHWKALQHTRSSCSRSFSVSLALAHCLVWAHSWGRHPC